MQTKATRGEPGRYAGRISAIHPQLGLIELEPESRKFSILVTDRKFPGLELGMKVEFSIGDFGGVTEIKSVDLDRRMQRERVVAIFRSTTSLDGELFDGHFRLVNVPRDLSDSVIYGIFDIRKMAGEEPSENAEDFVAAVRKEFPDVKAQIKKIKMKSGDPIAAVEIEGNGWAASATIRVCFAVLEIMDSE